MDLAASANLYLTAAQGRWYEAVLAEPSYQARVAEPLTHAGESLSLLVQTVTGAGSRLGLTVVDCGPVAAESVRRLRTLKASVRVRRYVAVDVNAHLLARVASAVEEELGLRVEARCQRFEDLSSEFLQRYADGHVLLLFGATGMNYEPDALVQLLRGLSYPGLLLGVESVLGQRDAAGLQAYESAPVRRFAFGPLWLMGAEREDFDFRAIASKDRIRLEFVARTRVALRHPEVPPLRPGDGVWTAFSRRPTLPQHQAIIARIARTFDTFVYRDLAVASLGKVSQEML